MPSSSRGPVHLHASADERLFAEPGEVLGPASDGDRLRVTAWEEEFVLTRFQIDYGDEVSTPGLVESDHVSPGAAFMDIRGLARDP